MEYAEFITDNQSRGNATETETVPPQFYAFFKQYFYENIITMKTKIIVINDTSVISKKRVVQRIKK